MIKRGIESSNVCAKVSSKKIKDVLHVPRSRKKYAVKIVPVIRIEKLQESDARNDTPLDTRVVMKLTENFVNPSSCTLYFDNFFTIIDLLKSLGEQGSRATGTIRENRINHECPLEESKSMRK
ncbi:piggyBac transposable element-derived protein 3 [Trichonephila inaurata madagascariensis]|uniref:PiggyBac transposable element-derived protein 3 n=1 Tax=Trichonephila inaurata madagascariensis TaxID=2747483 RepID=A0A8X7CRZ3_9ARAC|nr:piggyBac transposable element-derived protein 3 [Trichonephila inaurata madagascariensis]